MPKFVPASVAELSRIGLLAELPGETLNKLVARMRRETLEPGRGVIAEGDKGDEGDRFYVLLSGLLAVSSRDLGARRMLRPGDYFGEVAPALGVPRTASVTAMTRSTVASCDQATFDEFLRPLFSEAS